MQVVCWRLPPPPPDSFLNQGQKHTSKFQGEAIFRRAGSYAPRLHTPLIGAPKKRIFFWYTIKSFDPKNNVPNFRRVTNMLLKVLKYISFEICKSNDTIFPYADTHILL